MANTEQPKLLLLQSWTDEKLAKATQKILRDVCKQLGLECGTNELMKGRIKALRSAWTPNAPEEQASTAVPPSTTPTSTISTITSVPPPPSTPTSTTSTVTPVSPVIDNPAVPLTLWISEINRVFKVHLTEEDVKGFDWCSSAVLLDPLLWIVGLLCHPNDIIRSPDASFTPFGYKMERLWVEAGASPAEVASLGRHFDLLQQLVFCENLMLTQGTGDPKILLLRRQEHLIKTIMEEAGQISIRKVRAVLGQATAERMERLHLARNLSVPSSYLDENGKIPLVAKRDRDDNNDRMASPAKFCRNCKKEVHGSFRQHNRYCNAKQTLPSSGEKKTTTPSGEKKP